VSFAVIRLRGQSDLAPDHQETLESLRLHKPNHATIVPEDENYEGMLRAVEHFTTYGEPSEEMIRSLLETRGKGPGGVDLTDDYVDENTGFSSIDELASTLAEDEVDIGHVDAIKPVFRLSPARGGFKSTKRHYNEGGSLGNRGPEIDDLIDRML
jgi:large subunit ribosomal protein L30